MWPLYQLGMSTYAIRPLFVILPLIRLSINWQQSWSCLNCAEIWLAKLPLIAIFDYKLIIQSPCTIKFVFVSPGWAYVLGWCGATCVTEPSLNHSSSPRRVSMRPRRATRSSWWRDSAATWWQTGEKSANCWWWAAWVSPSRWVSPECHHQGECHLSVTIKVSVTWVSPSRWVSPECHHQGDTIDNFSGKEQTLQRGTNLDIYWVTNTTVIASREVRCIVGFPDVSLLLFSPGDLCAGLPQADCHARLPGQTDSESEWWRRKAEPGQVGDRRRELGVGVRCHVSRVTCHARQTRLSGSWAKQSLKGPKSCFMTWIDLFCKCCAQKTCWDPILILVMFATWFDL